MLTFDSGRPVEIGWVAGNAKYAVSGTRLLADNGAVLEGLDTSDADPRTAAGMSEDGHQLIIVVVDGRQLGYSQGATLNELAQILVDYGAYRAMELDGGGSSTLVIEDSSGQPKVLNSPVHQGSNGKERPVATHIGFFIQK
jgi:exopolysaccharide biosynthesis protein